jgi:hypothetical protein
MGDEKMSKQIVITQVGLPTSHPFKFDNAMPLVIEADTPDGPAILQISPRAAAVLAEQLPIYIGKYFK